MPTDKHEIESLKHFGDLTEEQLKSSRHFRKATVKGLRALMKELESLPDPVFIQQHKLSLLPSEITNLTTSSLLGNPKEEAKMWKEAACEAVVILCAVD